MRVMILSASTGSGYGSVAQSLAEQMEKLGMEYEVVDALSLISDTAPSFVSRWRAKIYRHFPKLFGLFYRYEEKHPPRFVYERCAKGADALYQKLTEGTYDAVLCVHEFAGMMMTEVRQRYAYRTPAYFVAPDYTSSPGVSEIKLDEYFVPHSHLFAEFIRAMVPANKLHATGIPVRSVFYEEMDKREMRRFLNLPETGKMVLLGCGSMGYGHLEKSALLLRKKLVKDSFLVVMCGRNEKAYETLLPYASNRLYVVSYTDYIAEYMSAADIYITKPGAQTTGEAIAKKLPMIFIHAIPGFESKNFNFLIRKEVADGGRNWNEVAHLMRQALLKEEILEKQIKAMEAFATPNAAETICRYILKNH